MSILTITNHQKKIIIVLALVALILTIYWQVQYFDFINYDDGLYVTQSSLTQSGLTWKGVSKLLADVHTGNWHPLTMLSHIVDWELFGWKAGGHHWSNLILHIINAVLLFLLLNQLTGAIWRSAMVAVLFSIHPINVESVAWVAERKNVLSTFFWFLTMLFYVHYVRKPAPTAFLPVVISFALGLMSKSMLVTLPFVLLLMDYWPLNRTVINAQDQDKTDNQITAATGRTKLIYLIKEKIPLFILTAVAICVTLYTQHLVGAVVSTKSLSLVQRISNAVFSYGLYIKKMFWPADLSVFYPRYDIEIWQILIVSILLVSLSIIILRYYRKYPYLSVGWFWYLGTMVPVIGFVQVGAQSMADRYAYVPFIGLFIMLVWYAVDVAGKSKNAKFSLALTSFLVILTLSVVAWQRCQLWGDQLALYNDALKNQKSALVYNLRGIAYAEKGQNELALGEYHAAVKLDEKFAEALNNRGNLYASMGQHENALRDFDEAQRLKPRYADAYYNKGLLYLGTRQLDAAIADFTSAIQLDTNNADYFNNRGVALRLKGDYKKSFADFNQALKINGNMAEAYFNRGIIYQMHSQYLPAIVNYTEALEIKPAYLDAYFNRGVLFAALGKFDQAIEDFRYVLQINPKYVPALNHLGILFEKMKRYEESSAQFQKSLQIQPDNNEALKHLKNIENMKKEK